MSLNIVPIIFKFKSIYKKIEHLKILSLIQLLIHSKKKIKNCIIQYQRRASLLAKEQNIFYPLISKFGKPF
jgi:hypothetical protein